MIIPGSLTIVHLSLHDYFIHILSIYTRYVYIYISSSIRPRSPAHFSSPPPMKKPNRIVRPHRLGRSSSHLHSAGGLNQIDFLDPRASGPRPVRSRSTRSVVLGGGRQHVGPFFRGRTGQVAVPQLFCTLLEKLARWVTTWGFDGDDWLGVVAL